MLTVLSSLHLQGRLKAPPLSPVLAAASESPTHTPLGLRQPTEDDLETEFNFLVRREQEQVSRAGMLLRLQRQRARGQRVDNREEQAVPLHRGVTSYSGSVANDTSSGFGLGVGLGLPGPSANAGRTISGASVRHFLSCYGFVVVPC